MHTLLSPEPGSWPLFEALCAGHALEASVDYGRHGSDMASRCPNMRQVPCDDETVGPQEPCELLPKLRRLMQSGFSPLHKAARNGDASLVAALLESQGFLPPEAAAAVASRAWAAAHRQHRASSTGTGSISTGCSTISTKRTSSGSSSSSTTATATSCDGDAGLQHLLLLRLMMHPDAPDARGGTPLHYACRRRRIDAAATAQPHQRHAGDMRRVIQLLLSAGAHADARNYAGHTPSMLLGACRDRQNVPCTGHHRVII